MSIADLNLKNAEVPAYCNMPAQRLVSGDTTKGRPGQGSLGTQVGYADFAGLGYRQALVVYECTAGGVGWPGELLLIGDGGKLLASYELSDVVPAEHAAVDRIAASGNTARVSWSTYNGCCFDQADLSATVSYQNGKLVLTGQASKFTPEAVADDILSAIDAKKRSSLYDPRVLSDAQWKKLLAHFPNGSFSLYPNSGPGTCTAKGDTVDCSLTGEEGNGDGYLTLSKTGQNGYGWKLTDLVTVGWGLNDPVSTDNPSMD